MSDVTLGEYFRQFELLKRLSSLISLSALPNLLLFFIFIWLNMYRAARGGDLCDPDPRFCNADH